jgi:hypothetical protein
LALLTTGLAAEVLCVTVVVVGVVNIAFAWLTTVHTVGDHGWVFSIYRHSELLLLTARN